MEISTSILNVNKENIIQTIYDLEVAKTDYFHVDVMDGRFTENDTSEKMRLFAEYLNQITNIPIDVHLMVNNVKEYIDSYTIFNPNIITFHFEACKSDEDIEKYIKYLKDNNCKVGLSIKPETPVEKIYKFLPKINLILVMTVEPGKGGQKFLDYTVNKIINIKNKIQELKLDTLIEVDGGINLETKEIVKQAGADIAVVGSAIINSKDFKFTINKLKE